MEYLKKAEIYSQSSVPFKTITLNNFACYYRRYKNKFNMKNYIINNLSENFIRIGQLRTSLNYLYSAK